MIDVVERVGNPLNVLNKETLFDPEIGGSFIRMEDYEAYFNNLGYFADAALQHDPAGLLSDMFRMKVQKMGIEMSGEAQPDISYPTGFLSIDYLMGYIAKEWNNETNQLDDFYNLGFTDGSYIGIVANSNTGKSTFAEQTIANIARRYKTSTIFVDSTESGGMTETRRMYLSKFDRNAYKKRYVIRNTGITIENVFERIKGIHDLKIANKDSFLYDAGHRDMYGNPIIKFEPTLYLIDSVSNIMPKDMLEEDEIAGKSYGAQIANKVTQLFMQIIQMLKTVNIILIGTNHIAQDIQMSKFQKKPDLPWLKMGERIPKGKKAILLANHIIRMDQVAKLTTEDPYKIQGSIVDFSLVKSRTSGNKEPIRMVYDFANGFDPWLSLLEYMKYNKLLYGAGISLSFDPEKTFKFSYGTFRDKIQNDTEFRKSFIKNVLPILKKIPIEVDESAKDMHIDELISNEDLYKV